MSKKLFETLYKNEKKNLQKISILKIKQDKILVIFYFFIDTLDETTILLF